MELIKTHWTDGDYAEFRGYLRSVSDEKYRAFHISLVPGAEERIIGIRIPTIRKIAKEIAKGDIDSFLKCSCGTANEEIMIEGLVMASRKCGCGELIRDIFRFADKIDNWAVNDVVKFPMISKYRREIADVTDKLLFGSGPWHTRYGLKILMDYYLDDEYIDFALEKTAAVRSEEYYVYMMQGWLLATAAVKYAEKVFELLESGRLTSDAAAATMGKMRDSRRISAVDKDRVQRIRNRISKGTKGGKTDA